MNNNKWQTSEVMTISVAKIDTVADTNAVPELRNKTSNISEDYMYHLIRRLIAGLKGLA